MNLTRSHTPARRSRPLIRFAGNCGFRLPASVLLLSVFVVGSVRAQSRPLLKLENENVYGFVLFDLLEAAPTQVGGPLQWDMIGSVGKTYDRFWIKSDGDLSTAERGGEMEFQALYSRLITPYWEAQAGVRFDVGYTGARTRTRVQLVVGLEGLAPYWFELEPAVFVSRDGDVSAALTGTYDLLVTQRLVLQPRLDVAAALQEVEAWGVGSGLNSIGLGVRLRYEIRREFAPYLGFGWTRLTGETADLARRRGERTNTLALVLGVRLWR